MCQRNYTHKYTIKMQYKSKILIKYTFSYHFIWSFANIIVILQPTNE